MEKFINSLTLHFGLKPAKVQLLCAKTISHSLQPGFYDAFLIVEAKNPLPHLPSTSCSSIIRMQMQLLLLMIHSDWLFEKWLAENDLNEENLISRQSLLCFLWRFIWIEHFFPNSLHFFPAKKTQNFRRYGLPKLGPAGHFSIVSAKGGWKNMTNNCIYNYYVVIHIITHRCIISKKVKRDKKKFPELYGLGD